ncbi:hypothetical protein BRARA_C03717 [Brassica rapa]|uniref:Uncharacterized protein n=1 Tax=Brassica campestris TaxID=3711 RepID=A0A398A9B9_BRACM|nr:hypothetical protein BRARA_C03717 [Brassica rapa]
MPCINPGCIMYRFGWRFLKAALLHATSLGITHIWLSLTAELYVTLSDIASLASSSFTSCRFSCKDLSL